MKKLLSLLLAAAMIMSFVVVPASAAEAHTHCWCKNAEASPENHTCDESIEWKKITANTTVNSSSETVYYYKADNTNRSFTVDGVDAFLCLNGYAMRAQTAITLKNNASLTLCDCSSGQTGYIGTSKLTPVTVGAGNTFNLMSGRVTGSYYSSNAASQVSHISVVLNGGTFNMYGGTINDGCKYTATATGDRNNKTANGANVNVASGVFNMYGGTIADGQAPNSGGNVAVSGGTFNMHGGTITDGVAGSYGGNIAVYSGGKLIIKNGTVTGGEATTHGGNISALSGTVDIYNGTISNGKSGTQGGNIAAAGGTITISGGEILDGQSGLDEASTRRYGGNISVNNSGELIVKGGTISGGTAPAFGGNIGIDDSASTIEISGGDITDGKSTTYGGNIGVNLGTVTISGTKATETTEVEGETVTTNTYSTNITGGKSTTYGGNIGTAGGTVNFQGGKIADGHAQTHGGNIGMGNGSFNMTGGDVYGGLAEDSGNGMSVRNNAKVNITGGAFVDTGINAIGTGAAVTLGGNARIFNIFLGTDKTIALDAENLFTGHAGITMQTPGDFLETETDYSDNFSSANTDYYVAFTDTAMTLKAYAVKIGSTGYQNLQDAINAADKEDYIRLLDNVTEDVQIDKQVFIDLNGKVLDADITGSGTLCGMDRSGDKYVAPTGRITGTVSCTLADHVRGVVGGAPKRYVAIADKDGYTFHRYYMGITHQTLRPGATGIGYKAVFCGDEQVRGLVTGYGYTMWVGENGEKKSVGTEGAFESGKTVTLLIKNFDIENYGSAVVNGQVYLKFGENTVLQSAVYSCNMKQLVESVNAVLESDVSAYTVEQISAIKNMCTKYSAAMEGWSIAAITGWTAPTTEPTE